MDATLLLQVAVKIKNGQAAPNPQVPNDPNSLTPQEFDVYGRFDLLLNTFLDQAYQRADQRYKNAARATAIPVAVILALVGAYLVLGSNFAKGNNIALAILAGLISTPIAPIAKDISSAISTAAQAIKFGKK
ncbi:MAG TPA: hypothetical protein VGK22_20410 [Candidatus Angelobacter sp.]